MLKTIVNVKFLAKDTRSVGENSTVNGVRDDSKVNKAKSQENSQSKSAKFKLLVESNPKAGFQTLGARLAFAVFRQVFIKL